MNENIDNDLVTVIDASQSEGGEVIPQKPERLYYYRPFSVLTETRYKCAGHGAEDSKHRAFYIPHFNDPKECKKDGNYKPGVIVVRGYAGDQLTEEQAKRLNIIETL